MSGEPDEQRDDREQSDAGRLVGQGLRETRGAAAARRRGPARVRATRGPGRRTRRGTRRARRGRRRAARGGRALSHGSERSPPARDHSGASFRATVRKPVCATIRWSGRTDWPSTCQPRWSTSSVWAMPNTDSASVSRSVDDLQDRGQVGHAGSRRAAAPWPRASRPARARAGRARSGRGRRPRCPRRRRGPRCRAARRRRGRPRRCAGPRSAKSSRIS